MDKILDIVDSIAYEKSLNAKDVKEALKSALIKSAQKVVGEHLNFDVEFDEQKRKAKLFQKITVLEDSDEKIEHDPENYIALAEAKELDESVEVGDELRYEIELESYGRSAALAMHREFEIELQQLVENEVLKKYAKKAGKIVTGQVVRVDNHDNTFIEIDDMRALMPKKNRIKGEVFKVGNVVKSVLKNIQPKKGVTFELTRTSPKFLEELLRLEVPEIEEGIITVEKCARIPGERAKVALSSKSPRVDPIGTTVGVKGVRINSVSKEIKNESIDVIEYSEIPEVFISRAMSPAVVKSVQIEGERAKVTVANGQKSKAIGKGGINIRLASMLTGFEIDILEDETEMLPSEGGGEERTQREQDGNALAALFGK